MIMTKVLLVCLTGSYLIGFMTVEYSLFYYLLLLLLFAIELFTFSVDFALLAIEFGTFVAEFVGFVLQLNLSHLHQDIR